jgi:hypothetical protein
MQNVDRKLLLPLVAVITLALAAPSASATTAAGLTISPSNNRIQIWALQSENINSNYIPVKPDQALLDASHFTYITAHPIAYAGLVPQMKAVNPNLRIFAYENAVFSQPSQQGQYPDSWFLRDSSGNKVTNPASGNFLMDPTQQGWIGDRISTCQSLLTQSGYDGCYLDMLGLASLRTGFVSGHPIDPRSGKPWVLNDWITATAALAGQVTKAANLFSPPALVFGNGVNSGALYYSPTTPTKPLLDALNGGLAEAWLRGSTVSITSYHEGVAWLDDVNVIGAAEAAGKPLLGLVKIGVAATQAQLDGWQQYGLATFLMGTKGRSAYFFSPSISTPRDSWYAMYDVLLGLPTTIMQQLKAQGGSIYQRNFKYGMTLVNNNTTTASATIAGGPYYDINGNVVNTSPLVLPANTGLILRTQLTPITTVTTYPGPSTTSTTVSIPFTSDTPGATFRCTLDGGRSKACTSPVTYSGLSLGPHLVKIRTTGPTGIVGANVPVAWDVNTGAAPTASFTATPANGSGSTASFSFRSSSPQSSFTCSLDNAAATLCDSPDQLTGLTTGVQHTFTVNVTDPYGVQGTAISYSWTP